MTFFETTTYNNNPLYENTDDYFAEDGSVKEFVVSRISRNEVKFNENNIEIQEPCCSKMYSIDSKSESCDRQERSKIQEPCCSKTYSKSEKCDRQERSNLVWRWLLRKLLCC